MATKILLTGASGYIGGRLLRRLEEENYVINCLIRNPHAIKFSKNDRVKYIQGDARSFEDLVKALQGVDTAFYLIHCMSVNKNFDQVELEVARNFAQAAKYCQVKRIIYVGGLGGDTKENLSAHLRTRHEVGVILLESHAQVLEFRASIVIGSGSISFAIVKSLVDRLPVMIMPKWVQVPAQPIWINDLLSYLEAAVDIKISGNHVFEIGGSDIVSYKEIMQEYAKQKGLKRLMINVPVLTPYLSSLWLGLITPVFARIGRKLVCGVKNPTIVTNNKALSTFNIRPVGLNMAIHNSINHDGKKYAETRWSDAFSSSGLKNDLNEDTHGNDLNERPIKYLTIDRHIIVEAGMDESFAVIESLGGETGWLFADWMWNLRGFIDLLIGGVGVRRGRKHPHRLNIGETVDWWRVEKIIPSKLLRLKAEMKVPGKAWLIFEVKNYAQSKCTNIRLIAKFAPQQYWGVAYWYIFYPIHVIIFKGMLKNIAKKLKEFNL